MSILPKVHQVATPDAIGWLIPQHPHIAAFITLGISRITIWETGMGRYLSWITKTYAIGHPKFGNLAG